MPVALGALPSAAPVPVGVGTIQKSSVGGLVARPAAGNFMFYGPGQAGNFELAAPARPYRFWWRVGASQIVYATGAWERLDWQLQLLINNYTYGNDLNNIGVYQQIIGSEGSGHADPWNGSGIEGLFYCEANSNYWVRFLAAGGGGNYYQHPVHLNMWSYTIAEGVY